MLTTVEVRPADGRKSFYGKAKLVLADGSLWWVLESYHTDVALIRKGDDGRVEIIRMWMGYSRTTMRHINGALRMLGASQSLTKSEWEGVNYKGKVVVE